MQQSDGTLHWQLSPQEADIIIRALIERPLKEVVGVYSKLMEQSKPGPETPPPAPTEPPQD